MMFGLFPVKDWQFVGRFTGTQSGQEEVYTTTGSRALYFIQLVSVSNPDELRANDIIGVDVGGQSQFDTFRFWYPAIRWYQDSLFGPHSHLSFYDSGVKVRLLNDHTGPDRNITIDIWRFEVEDRP